MKQSHRLIKCFSFFLVLSLLAAGAAFTRSASAQEPTPVPTPGDVFNPGIQLNAYPAYDGYYKYGEWLPVWVEVSNTGPDVSAEVNILVSGTNAMLFSAPLELPSGAHKRLAVYVLPNNFTHQLNVELDAGDQRLATKRIDVNPQATITYLAGLVSPQRGALTAIDDIAIPGQKRPIQLVDVPLSDLPDKYEGLRSFDLLVVNGADTSSLTPEQNHALESWVRQGGRLVLGGGPSAAALASGLGQNLLPISGLTTHEVDSLHGLEEFTGADENGSPRSIRVPGPFVVAAGQAEGARSLARQGDLPLVSEWKLDRGLVDFVALDLAGSPFDAWNGTGPFWEHLVSATAAYPEYAAPDMSARQQFASAMTYPLSNLPMLDLPSVKSLALLLGVYILLVGPLNYLILRRSNRLHLAWITIPLITLIFTAASFGLGYALHGTDIFVNKIAIVQLEPSGRARVDSFIGLFSPARRAYEVQIHDSGLVSPLNPYTDPWSSAGPNPGAALPESRRITLVQGNPAYVRGLSVEQWSMQSFMSEGSMIDFGPVESDLHLENDQIVGELHNNSSHAITDAAVILGNRFIHLGDIPAGGSASVNLDLSASPVPNNGSPISYALFQEQLSGANGPAPRPVEVRRAIVEALFERTPPYVSSKMPVAQSQASNMSQTPMLVGWLDQAPPDVQVSGTEPAQQTTAVLVLPLTYQIPTQGAINLPPGLLPGRLVETPQEGGTCGTPGTNAVYISRGQAVYEFSLPSDLKPKDVQNFKLNLTTDSGFFNQPEVSIYDWELGDWLTLQGVSQGLNLIPATPSLIGSDGAVRFKLGGDNLQICYYIDLGAEGARSVNAIATRSLTRRFGKVEAVEDLNLKVPAGSLYGLIGPNGAGKTTTLRMLAGLLEPSSGEIRINELPVRKYWREIQWQIGYMPDFFGVYDDLVVWEYLDFFARCYKLAPDRRRRVIDELFALVDLTEKRDAYVHTLSRGMRQRLCLAHALVHEPSVLLLDEPASGLDPRARVEMRELLRELSSMGKTILLSSHILTELAELCDYIAIMERGKLVVSGSLSEIHSRAAEHRMIRIHLLSDWKLAAPVLAAHPAVRQIFPLDDSLPGKNRTNGNAEAAADGSAASEDNRPAEQAVALADSLDAEPATTPSVDAGAPGDGGVSATVIEIEFQGDNSAAADLLEQLIAHGVRVAAFGEVSTNLEEAFLRLTKGEVA